MRNSSAAKEKAMYKALKIFTVWIGLLAGDLTAFAQSTIVNGQVTKVDQSAGKITIKHGPLKQFGMEEGMTMVFRAEDPTLLNNVKPGDKIRFMPNQVNGQFTVTTIEKIR
jgi:Cu(I)/Ag(I) efflux system periplasmic protein CusF